MVGVAQLVRAPDCGSGGRGFETRHSPHTNAQRSDRLTETFNHVLASSLGSSGLTNRGEWERLATRVASL